MSTRISILLGLLGLIVGCNRSTARDVMRTVPLEIELANPRKMGAVEYHTTDGSSKSSARTDDSEIEILSYSAKAVVLCEQADGKIICPFIMMRSPRYGAFGVYYETVRSHPIFPISPRRKEIFLPFSTEIRNCFIVLETTDENSGQRILTIDTQFGTTPPAVAVPDILKLPTIESHPRGDELKAAYPHEY